jgi:ribose transport system substrate-binding protein
MEETTMKKLGMKAAIMAAGLAAIMGGASADPMADAQATIEKYAGRVDTWDGPTTGPKAVEGKTIVVLAGDMKNGGILGVADGLQEAGAVLGWNIRVLDGAGSVQSRTAIFNQAMTLQPDGIAILGFDAIEQQVGVEAAKAAGIPLVAWHAGPKIGPDPDNGIFTNVTTDPMEVSASAARWAFVDAKGAPKVVIFTDSCCAIALAKADRIKEEIEALGGEVLEYVDTPIADTANRMPTLTTALLQRYGASWTHSIAINDIYFDFMGPSLAAAGLGGTDQPIAVAAGDGSESAYQRIRTSQYQAVTVAEPLNLQGWQLIDELNRAVQGEEPSGYVSPLHIVTADNIQFDGGAENKFDPENGYRQQYQAIWGK